MKASELRIGNYISVDEMLLNELLQEIGIITEDKQFNISLISNDYCNIIIENQEIEIDIKDLEPIQMTEDWLVKFGFNKFPQRKLYDRDDFWALHPRNGNEWHFDFLECKIYYVHQLQNLYFALTGKELTYES